MIAGSSSDLTAAKRATSQDAFVGRARPSAYIRTRVSSQSGADAITTKNYVLGDCLGKGAFGSVYRALNFSTGETVAVKRISLGDIPQSELGAIMSEIELLKDLKHPSIVKYKGYELTRDYLFIILEYCENGSLQSICKRFGNFPEGLVSIYISQVLEGLQYLHEQGVIHRDIKGANLLTNKDGSVKLADFGVATKAGALAGKSVAGSPYWMAPEVIDQSGAVAASDIWSVGCVIIELLEGQPPYASLDPMPALFRIVQDDCPPLPRGASPMVTDFLLHCFEKDANLRVSAKTLLEHPWMCLARRQLRQMKSNGSIGRAVHDHAVRTVRDHNRSPGRKHRRRPTPLEIDRLRPSTADPHSSGLVSPRSLRRVSGSITACSSGLSSPSHTTPAVIVLSPFRSLDNAKDVSVEAPFAAATASLALPCRDLKSSGLTCAALGIPSYQNSTTCTSLQPGHSRWLAPCCPLLTHDHLELDRSAGRSIGGQCESSQGMLRDGAICQATQRSHTKIWAGSTNILPLPSLSDMAPSRSDRRGDTGSHDSDEAPYLATKEQTIKPPHQNRRPAHSTHRQDCQRADTAAMSRSAGATVSASPTLCQPTAPRTSSSVATGDVVRAISSVLHEKGSNALPSHACASKASIETAKRRAEGWNRPSTGPSDISVSPRTSFASVDVAHKTVCRLSAIPHSLTGKRVAHPMESPGLPPHSPTSIPLLACPPLPQRVKRDGEGRKRPLSLLTRSLSGSSASSSGSRVEARGSICTSTLDRDSDRCAKPDGAGTVTKALAGPDKTKFSSRSPSRDFLIQVLQKQK